LSFSERWKRRPSDYRLEFPEAFKAGHDASRAALSDPSKADNPYPPESLEAKAWVIGWNLEWSREYADD
jgi:hypothetical protein